jgi:hypothetical protein
MAKRSKKERKRDKRREKLRHREEAAYRRELRAEHGLTNPYSHEPNQDAKIEEDFAVMREAWKEHFGDEVGEEFYAPLDPEEPHSWVFTYKDLMIEKYGSIGQAAPRVKFMLTLLLNTPVYRARYDAAEQMQEDLVLVHDAWLEFFGEVGNDFVPEFTIDGKPHPWIEVFERLMIGKYGSAEGVERAKFVVTFCRDAALDRGERTSV